MNTQLRSRREFKELCAMLSLSLAPVTAMVTALFSAQALAAGPGAASSDAQRTIKFHDGTTSRHLVRALRDSRKDDIRKAMRKTRRVLVFRSE